MEQKLEQYVVRILSVVQFISFLIIHLSCNAQQKLLIKRVALYFLIEITPSCTVKYKVNFQFQTSALNVLNSFFNSGQHRIFYCAFRFVINQRLLQSLSEDIWTFVIQSHRIAQPFEKQNCRSIGKTVLKKIQKINYCEEYISYINTIHVF